ncbi:MAG: hypothetical protein HY391_01065, partial [Deltaproteobacteria bacterium]|nr:hypothetical protein [Deltaproteobacteria bacterium]
MNPQKVIVVFFAFLTFSPLLQTLTFRNPAFALEEYVFEDASEFGYEILNEEEEEVFFHRGKFINAGARGGIRFFTGKLGNLYDLGPAFGIFGAYFFSFSLAGELAFDTSFHRFKLTSGQTGVMTLLDILLRLKYYPFSETTVKALADSNPYLSIGAG